MEFETKRQIILPMRTKLFLRWSRCLFLIIGIFALSYCGIALLDAKLYQAYQTWRFQQALDLRSSPLSHDLAKAKDESTESLGIAVSEGAPLGRIEISTIGLAVMILEGADKLTLQRGVGHIPGTSLPGQQGNVAIAGHRDTFFSALRNIRQYDEIRLTTLNGSYLYRVHSTKVVKPENTEVLDDTNEDILTLVTCYPFDFVGSAPKRFIVLAHRVLGSDLPESKSNRRRIKPSEF